MSKLVSFFGLGTGNKELLGNKGFHLDQMTKMNLPVPEGFTITTDAYHQWATNREITSQLEEEIVAAVSELEQRTGRVLGKGENPLFVSVRSGASVSMPGMMDTILNIGSNEESIAALAEQYSNQEFAYSLLRSFMRSYMGLVKEEEIDFEDLREDTEYTPLMNLCRPAACDELEDLISAIKEGTDITPFLFELTEEFIFNRREGSIPLFTGSVICENLDWTKKGKITLVTEEYVQVRWDDRKTEKISYDCYGHLTKNRIKRKINLFPQLFLDVAEYVKDEGQIGEFIPDTLRVWNKLWDIPDDPMYQILEAVDAVFKSWESDKAVSYREEHDIPDNLGTAVNIQRMVFGNCGLNSGTAVLFSSCPKTAKKGITGEYLFGFQGESLVSGEQTPADIKELSHSNSELHQSLESLAEKLEQGLGCIQDVEVTWEDPTKVYLLQTRTAEISPKGKIAYLLREYNKGNLSAKEVIARVSLEEVQKIATVEELDIPSGTKPLVQGKSILEGIVSGRIVFSLDDTFTKDGVHIYCRPSTSTEDIEGIRKCDALLTTSGGAYSHAAIVALSMRKVAVVGCTDAQITGDAILFNDGKKLSSGDYITIDGCSGNVYAGVITKNTGRKSNLIQELAKISKEILPSVPEIYEIQSLDDLALVENDTEHPEFMYDIDFDCYSASGLLEGNSLPERKRKSMIKERAAEVYQQFRERYRILPTLKISGKFGDYGSYLKEANWFLAQFVKMAKGDGINTSWLQSGKIKKLPLGMTVHPSETYQNGRNCVLVFPWAREESYISAAQEVLRNESY